MLAITSVLVHQEIQHLYCMQLQKWVCQELCRRWPIPMLLRNVSPLVSVLTLIFSPVEKPMICMVLQFKSKAQLRQSLMENTPNQNQAMVVFVSTTMVLVLQLQLILEIGFSLHLNLRCRILLSSLGQLASSHWIKRLLSLKELTPQGLPMNPLLKKCSGLQVLVHQRQI